MSTLLANDFTSYEFTPEEEREGRILTITQLEVLQNDRAAVAMDLIEENEKRTDQERAYLRGQLDTLRKILNAHLDAVAARFNEAKSDAEFAAIKPPLNLDAYQAFRETQENPPAQAADPSNLK